jgi:hypothetical protein
MSKTFVPAVAALAALIAVPALAHHGNQGEHPVTATEEITAAQQVPVCGSNRPRVNPNGSKAKCPLIKNPGSGPVTAEPVVQPPVVMQDQ